MVHVCIWSFLSILLIGEQLSEKNQLISMIFLSLWCSVASWDPCIAGILFGSSYLLTCWSCRACPTMNSTLQNVAGESHAEDRMGATGLVPSGPAYSPCLTAETSEKVAGSPRAKNRLLQGTREKPHTPQAPGDFIRGKLP